MCHWFLKGFFLWGGGSHKRTVFEQFCPFFLIKKNWKGIGLWVPTPVVCNLYLCNILSSIVHGQQDRWRWNQWLLTLIWCSNFPHTVIGTWMLTIHKDITFWKNLHENKETVFKHWVKIYKPRLIMARSNNGAHKVSYSKGHYIYRISS